MESPEIRRHSADRELLRTGDNLTCTVTGGRPTVDEVIFYCTDPRLDGHPGDVSVTSVSSVITVDSAHATGNNMTCFCSATWTPIEDFYDLSSQETYNIERKTFLCINYTSFGNKLRRLSYSKFVSDNDVLPDQCSYVYIAQQSCFLSFWCTDVTLCG